MGRAETEMGRIVVFGTGTLGRLAHWYFRNDSPHEVVAFTEDAAHRRAASYLGLPLVDFEDLVSRYPPDDYHLFIAIGYTHMNRVRADRYRQAKAQGYELPSYVHRHSTIYADAIGDNCFIMEGNSIQPFVRIGNDVTMLPKNGVGHDTVVGDHSYLAGNVSVAGQVEIGEYCFLGIGSTVRNRIRLGARTLVGAGAVILQHTEEGSVYVLPRARKLPLTSDDADV